MTPQAPPSPFNPVAELGALLVRLIMNIAGGVSWGGISSKAVSFINARFNRNRLRIERIVERIRNGTYKPRRPATPRPAAETPRPPRPPRPPDLIRQTCGWLLPLLPATQLGIGSQFEVLLRSPEMAALIEAAPQALGRPLRSFCWMFRITPPPNIAPPKRPRKPRPAPDPQAAPAEPTVAGGPPPLRRMSARERRFWGDVPRRRPSRPRPGPQPA